MNNFCCFSGEFSNDAAYGTLKDVINGSCARDRNVSDSKSKKRKKKSGVRKNSDSTLENVDIPSQVSSMGSKAGSTPRSMAGLTKTENHIKDSGNPKLLKWLKEKDKEHRRKAKEEKKKKREEREKMVIEANEKFEKRLEAQKIYKKWVDEKNKEILKQEKQERKERKLALKLLKEKEKLTDFSVRPKSATLSRRDENGGIKVEGNSKTNVNLVKVTEDEVRPKSSPHPPSSKFIYKRPVAGRIKLKLEKDGGNRPRPQSAHAGSAITSEENMQRQRMSYDDWITRKRREDQRKKQLVEQRKHEDMSKSDPELNKLIPEIAKKRIHNVLEGKKRIDTGIKRIDDNANQSFGGVDFDASSDQQVRHSYRLDSDRSSTGSARIRKPPTPTRPKTAPHGGSRVIPPKQSSGSPRKALVPARVEETMSNEDTANPFRLPFSADQGIPKHVAAKQRQLFAERVWDKIENSDHTEPQCNEVMEPDTCVGTDNQEPRKVQQSEPINQERNKKIDDEESKVFLTQFNSVDNLSNIVNQTEQGQNVNEKLKQVDENLRTDSEGDSEEEMSSSEEEEKQLNSSSSKEEEKQLNSSGIMDNGDKVENCDKDDSMDKIDSDKSEESETEDREFSCGVKMKQHKIIEPDQLEQKECEVEMKEAVVETYVNQEIIEIKKDDKEALPGNMERGEFEQVEQCDGTPGGQQQEDDDDDMPGESFMMSRSSNFKRVSFREEPEVILTEQEEHEGSTDTQTPDDDSDHVKFFEEGTDISASLDLAGESEKINSVSNSLDDDF